MEKICKNCEWWEAQSELSGSMYSMRYNWCDKFKTYAHPDEGKDCKAWKEREEG